MTQLCGQWHYPNEIYFGAGRISELSLLCKSFGIQSPLLVTDSGLVKLPMIAEILGNLREDGLEADVFSDVKPNPTGSNIEQGVTFYKKGKHDGVVAIGGGSGLDAGKAIALMAGQKRPLWDFEDCGDNWTRVNPAGIAPLIAVPTTAGTGSEVGRASVILDEKAQAKKIIFHPRMLPLAVIADPELTLGLPPSITAATGIDAFVHSLEAFMAPGFHPMADGIALESMRIISRQLPLAFKNGQDINARSWMLAASSMGATAFQKGLGGIHALAHPLGALFDAHHGLLNAILLPYVLLHNKSVIEEKSRRIALHLELPQPGFDSLLEWILAFRKELSIAHTLQEIGIDDSRAEHIGQLAYADPSATGNPIQFVPKAYSRLFCDAVKGCLQEKKAVAVTKPLTFKTKTKPGST